MKKYIVCFTSDKSKKIKDGSGCVKHNYKDYYKVFAHGTSAENKKDAKLFFEEIKEKADLYTVSICLIVDSTDY